MPVTLPPWIPSVPRADDLNAQTDIYTGQVPNRRTPIPIAYGAFQTEWLPCVAAYNAGTWTVLGIIAMGELNAISAHFVDGAAPGAEITINTYLGTTSQTVDPLMQAARAGWSSPLIYTDPDGNQIGIAYLVAQFSDEDFPSWPEIIVEGQGRKIWDPDAALVQYSDTPVLAQADLIRNGFFGLGETVNDASLSAAAATNDEDVSEAPRRRIGLVIRNRQDTERLVKETMRGYSACWANKWGDQWYFTPDRPRTADAVITADDIHGVPQIGRSDELQRPTQVRILFTDTTTPIWRTRSYTYPETLPAGTPRRLSEIRLPGVHRYAQAVREAQERYNKLEAESRTVTWIGYDAQVSRGRGDVVDLTHPIGLTNELLRVTGEPTEVDPGLWRVPCAAYDATVYSDAAPADPGGAAAERYFGSGFQIAEGGSTIYYQSSAPAGETGAYWIDSDTDYLYRWNGSAWVLVQDDDIAQAISDAADAQSTADGKIVTFAQASAPTAEGVGDVWLDTDDDNHLYRWNGSAWVDYEQDVADWAKVFGAAKPEDNATAGADVGTNLRDAAGNVISDQVITNFDDASAFGFNPAFANWTGVLPDGYTGQVGTAPTKHAVGDSPVDPLTGPYAVRFVTTGIDNAYFSRVYTAASFHEDSVLIGSFDAYLVSHTAGGEPGFLFELQTSGGNYFRKEAPIDTSVTGAWQRVFFKLSKNDFTDQVGTPSGRYTELTVWPMGSWAGFPGGHCQADVIFDSLRFAILSPDIENEAQLWNDINGIPDQLRSIFYQSTAPTANQTGDYWIDSDTNLQYRWNGSSWVEIQDDDISAALSDAATAQATADGKIVAFAQASAPAAEGVGDIWLDTDDNNRLYRWSGAAWVEYAQEEADWALVFGTGKPEDNATNNTGALADQDTVGQFDIDTFAAHRTSFAQVSSVSVAGAGGSYVTVETVNITLPATITDSAVLVEVSFVFLAQEASPTGTSQAVQTLFCRILDDDNAVIQEQGVRYPVIMDNVNEASVFSRYAMQAQAITIRVPVADLNANQANTFTFQVLQVSGFDSANMYDVKMRATLLNQAE